MPPVREPPFSPFSSTTTKASVQVVRAAVLIPNPATYREEGEDIERDGDRGPRGCVT